MLPIHKIVFIINPFSGRKLGAQIAHLLPHIMKSDYPSLEYYILLTEENGVNWPENGDWDEQCLFISIGGDGTASLVINFLLSQRIPVYFSIIPIGVGNDLAREFGFGRPISHFFTREKLRRSIHQIIRSNHTSLFDVFSLNGIPMINYCSMGYDATIISQFVQTRKKLGKIMKLGFLNKSLYFILGITNIFYKIPAGMIEIEILESNDYRRLSMDRKIKNILISNIRSYGGGSKLYSSYSVEDGIIEIAVIHHQLQYLVLALSRFIPRMASVFENSVTVYRTSHVRLSIKGNLPAQIDGEKIEFSSHIINLEHSGKIKVIKR